MSLRRYYKDRIRAACKPRGHNKLSGFCWNHDYLDCTQCKASCVYDCSFPEEPVGTIVYQLTKITRSTVEVTTLGACKFIIHLTFPVDYVVCVDIIRWMQQKRRSIRPSILIGGARGRAGRRLERIGILGTIHTSASRPLLNFIEGVMNKFGKEGPSVDIYDDTAVIWIMSVFDDICDAYPNFKQITRNVDDHPACLMISHILDTNKNVDDRRRKCIQQWRVTNRSIKAHLCCLLVYQELDEPKESDIAKRIYQYLNSCSTTKIDMNLDITLSHETTTKPIPIYQGITTSDAMNNGVLVKDVTWSGDHLIVPAVLPDDALTGLLN